MAEGATLEGQGFITSSKTEGDREIRLGGIGHMVAMEIETLTKNETRCVVLGHLQRRGQPTQWDRQLCTRFGVHAFQMITKKQFGYMVALKKNGMMGPVTLSEAINKLRLVDPEGELVMTARALGISFGDEPKS